MDDFKQESRHQLKVEKTKMIRRKLAEQAREEENSNLDENKENHQSTMIAVEVESVDPVTVTPVAPVKLNDRDAFAVKLNDYTTDQLKKLKVSAFILCYDLFCLEISEKQNRHISGVATFERIR